jgi:hypothetical protein
MQRPANDFLSTVSCCAFGDEFESRAITQTQQRMPDDLVVRHRRTQPVLVSSSPAWFTTSPHGLQDMSATTGSSGKGGNRAAQGSRSASSQASRHKGQATGNAVGSVAVDLTNLFLNPHKPSAINMWQGAHDGPYAHGPRHHNTTFAEPRDADEESNHQLDRRVVPAHLSCHCDIDQTYRLPLRHTADDATAAVFQVTLL